MKNEKFLQANEMFVVITKVNKEQGLGEIKLYPPTEDADMRKLTAFIKKAMHGDPNPTVLQQITVFHIIYYLCRRGRENLRKMTVGSFAFAIDPDNNLHYTYKTG